MSPSYGQPTATVRAHPLCNVAVNLVAGALESAQLYLLRTFVATSGNPYVAGTFTPATVMEPRPINIPFWVIRGRAAAPGATTLGF